MKKIFLSPLIIFVLFLVGYELYTGYKGREFLSAAHFVEGLSLATPIKMRVVEYYMTQGEFPESNEELGLPTSRSIRSRSVKSIEVSMGGKITITYNSALKEDSTLILKPTIPHGYTAQSVEWVCMTETIDQSVLDSVSTPCFYAPPGNLNDLMDSIVVSSEAQARAAITAGVDVNGSLHGDTPLLAAIARDRFAIMKQLIKAGADVNHRSVLYKGLTPLMHASRLGRERMCNLLLDSGANIDAVDNNGKSALMYAAKNGRKNIIKLLLSRGASPLLLDKRGRDASYYAKKSGYRSGNVKLIEREKLQYSTTLKPRGQASRVSELMRAAGDGDVNKLRQLIVAGAAIDAVDSRNATALHYSLESRNNMAANALIKAGVNVNKVDRDKNTPLLLAVKNGAGEVVSLLLDRGANINVQDRYHDSPFILAIRYGHKNIVELLLTKKVEEFINAALYESFISPAPRESLMVIQQLILDSKLKVDNDEDSLADLLVKAVKMGRIPVIRFLLSHDVRLDLSLDDDGLPIHVASKQGSYEIVKLLVDNGANIDAVNRDGKTALMFAVENRNIQLVRYLLEAGSDINVTNVDGLTALRMAKANYSEDIVNLLRRFKNKQLH